MKSNQIWFTLYAEGDLADYVRKKKSQIIFSSGGARIGTLRDRDRKNKNSLQTLKDGYIDLKTNDRKAKQLDLPEPKDTRLFFMDKHDNIIYLNWDDKFPAVKKRAQSYPTLFIEYKRDFELTAESEDKNRDLMKALCVKF